MMITRILLTLIGLCPLTLVAQDGAILESPNKQLNAAIEIKSDHAVIKLSAKGEPLVEIRTLQFSTEKDIIEGDWQLIQQDTKTVDQTWHPLFGERAIVVDKYNQLILTLTSASNQKEMKLRVRMYNEGLAFQYAFDETDFWNQTLIEENTQFLFDKDYTTWVSARAQGAYAKSTLQNVKGSVDRPIVIKISQNRYVAIGEAALVDYARMKLKKSSTGHGVQSDLTGKVNLDMADYQSPWRFILVADSPSKLVENNDLILNLNEPNEIKNAAWIKPGKVLREVTLTTQGALASIDFAAKNQFHYVEFDAGWYGNEYDKKSDASTVTIDPKRSKGPFDLEKIIEYANQKNVGILLYINMNALAKQLDQVLPLYQKWGIKGVKYGFVNVGDQLATTWLHHAVRKAAKYELMVDIHDEYRPTGYSRTYPNLMTQEGIRGDEETPSLEQTIYTLFTRMIAGAGDFTNCYFSDRVASDKMGGKAAQLAKAVALYSPWQFLYWYDRPEGSPRKAAGAGSAETIIDVKDKGVDFYRNLPVVWDESKYLAGEMGKYAVVARKSNEDWYVGVLNASDKKELIIDLSFLDKEITYSATIYYQSKTDRKKNKINTRTIIVQHGQSLPITLEANSGCAISIKK